MARLPRLSLPGLPHCLLQSAVHGSLLAHDDRDRAALLAALHESAARHRVALWGYALLPQALHLVACPADADGLGHLMQTLGRRYVPDFNRRHGRNGALWAGRFRASVVEPGDWLLAALARVDRLGLAHEAEGAWSSAGHHLGRRRDPALVDPPELWALGNTPFERESAWQRRLALAPDPATEAALARAVHGTWAAGSPAFLARAAALSGRPVVPRPAGRPAKAHPTDAVPKKHKSIKQPF